MGELALVKYNERQVGVSQNQSLFFDIARFEHAQRIANMFSKSTMVPDHFRSNVGNCLIALNYAERVGADVFMIMQSLYVVHGRPGIEAKLAIALLNSSGRFTPLKFTYSKDKTECTAHATDIATNEKCEGPTISIDMAKKEGWYNKKGSKWQTLPDLMLMYRSASFFIKMYAPEVLLGMQTKEELEDVFDLEKQNNGTYAPTEQPEAFALEKLTKEPVEPETKPPKVKDFESGMSNDAYDEIEGMQTEDAEAYLQAVKQYGKEPETDEDVVKIGLIYSEILDSGGAK